ncbi:MAG TPA: dihydrofolate reductase family protein [Gaiellaceae bacterium]|nr:dihydrofolate reductase family protein [Gaiellaceae bacterium]
MEPFDVLVEETGLTTIPLPPGLARTYGGDLTLAEESVFANFVATIDGVVAIPSVRNSNTVIAGDSDADRFLMGLLRAVADAVLIGAGVLRASPTGTWRAEKIHPPAAESYAELRTSLGLPEAPEIAILTGSGSIDPAHPVLEGRAVVLTSDVGVDRLAGKLPDSATMLSLGSETRFDGARIVEALRDRGHRRILAEAGPHTFGSLLDANTVDELFLTTSPFLAGDVGAGSRFRLVEAADLVPLVDCRLLGIRRHGAHVFTRYAIEKRAS